MFGDCVGGWDKSGIRSGAEQWGGGKLLPERAKSRNMSGDGLD